MPPAQLNELIGIYKSGLKDSVLIQDTEKSPQPKVGKHGA